MILTEGENYRSFKLRECPNLGIFILSFENTVLVRSQVSPF